MFNRCFGEPFCKKVLIEHFMEGVFSGRRFNRFPLQESLEGKRPPGFSVTCHSVLFSLVFLFFSSREAGEEMITCRCYNIRPNRTELPNMSVNYKHLIALG